MSLERARRRAREREDGVVCSMRRVVWCRQTSCCCRVCSRISRGRGSRACRCRSWPAPLCCRHSTGEGRLSTPSKTVEADSLPLQNSSDAKITKLHHTRLRQKDILWEGVRAVLETPPTSTAHIPTGNDLPGT